VLVTHDRYLLDRVSTVVLGLDGLGSAERFANYSQWDAWQQSQHAKTTPNAVAGTRNSTAKELGSQPAFARKKLSYMEAREFATLEDSIAGTEQALRTLHAELEDPAVQSDAPRLQSICVQIEGAQNTVDKLYARWAELEGRNG
jgi:ATP-binding cassette subfamily F protein uup